VKLLAKFNVILIVLFGSGMALISRLAYDFLKQDARAQVLQQAQLMVESARAMRDYTSDELEPLLVDVPDAATKFLPQIIPFYSATQIFARLRKQFPEYTYKEAALRCAHASTGDVFVSLSIADAEHGSAVNPHAQAEMKIVLRGGGDGDGTTQGRFRTPEKRQGHSISGDLADELAIALGRLHGRNGEYDGCQILQGCGLFVDGQRGEIGDFEAKDVRNLHFMFWLRHAHLLSPARQPPGCVNRWPRIWRRPTLLFRNHTTVGEICPSHTLGGMVNSQL
jgi:hypothetical protein